MKCAYCGANEQVCMKCSLCEDCHDHPMWKESPYKDIPFKSSSNYKKESDQP